MKKKQTNPISNNPSAPPNTPVALDDLLAHAQNYAEEMLRNRDHVPPVMFAELPFGILPISSSDVNDARDRSSFQRILRLICVGYEAASAVVVLDAWMRMAKLGERLDLSEPVSEASDRREVVLVVGETSGLDKQRRAILQPIIRTDAGEFLGLGDELPLDGDRYEGLFAELFPAQQPTPADRQLARAILDAIGITAEQVCGSPTRN